ncbi:carboxypeptidase-like regulatory domain-containing protein [Methyloceanibacter caenitepidi]|uniref:Uncharacterized protein n=1 Tax=Methyloceanibacter caenitepidi TaxID=1384459 RepID=A0A0A8K7I1_9HYPH|nr:carboxypeptidase-like regulatory domain-containing protein [Methyloceanibacter caenitepidi]BAQ18771.1 hypothetical protein GL4_3347 [Methyloceanibacter caenitepidi]
MRSLITLMLALILATAAPAARADNSDISGTLAMPNGKAIKGYPVILSGTFSSGATQYWVTTTDEAGAFNFEGMPAGQYTVTPANEPTASHSVTIQEKQKTFLDYFSTATGTAKEDVGTLTVAPGDKLQTPSE